MKFLNFSIIMKDGSGKVINTEYTGNKDEIFADVIEKVLAKNNIEVRLDNIVVKDVENVIVDSSVWKLSLAEVTEPYGILFIIEVHPIPISAGKKDSAEDEKPSPIAPPSTPSSAPLKPGINILVKSPRADVLEQKPLLVKDVSSEKDHKKMMVVDDKKSRKEPGRTKRSDAERYRSKESWDVAPGSAKAFDESEDGAYERQDVVAGPQEYDKNIGVEYYDRMNPENIYILKLEISDNIIETVATQENLLTGERFTQKKDKLKVLLEDPKVLVRPLFPGCLVTPPEQWTDFELEKDELIFQITPLVKTEINASIDFLSNQNLVYRVNLPAKVDDPRYAKTIAAYGTGISILPKVLPWFGIDAGESISILDALPFLGVLFGDMMLNNFIAIFGIGVFLILGIVFFFKKQAKFSKVKFRLDDIANFQSALKKKKKMSKNIDK